MPQHAPATGETLGSVSLRYRPLQDRTAFCGAPWGLRRAVYYGFAQPVDGQRQLSATLGRMARLEAVLLLAREPLSTRKLAQLANLADGTQARTLIGCLRDRYDRRSSGFQVEEVAGGFQLLTRPEFGKWLRRVQESPIEVRLSGPAMETMVVVAYCQPVLRAEIEAVRGVQCGEILRQLLERDLVRIVGRSDDLGRPFLYGTTRRFLQVFGLRHLDELPWAGQLRNMGVPKKTAVENRDEERHDRQSG